jgi:N-acetylglucosaminyl-diphospho-decaprenol L-rhamnosyltransferase
VPIDIAFITVNFNTLEWVRRLTDFFGNVSVPFTFSFTVVDNNSEDGSQQFLQSHPEVHYIQSGENSGYGRAMNRGVSATNSKYVCVTNTDVILNEQALITLWRFLEQRPDVGVCAPRIVYEDGRNQGMVFHRSLFAQYATWLAKIRAWYTKEKIAKALAPLRVDGVMGAFFLIRRAAIPAPALFDEDFFFFHEDVALTHTLMNRGVPSFVVPAATIIHVGGQSRSSASIAFFYATKYLYLKKFYGSLHAKAIRVIDRTRILRKWSFYSLFSLLSDSERIAAKQHYYRTAWKSVGDR